jgi:ApaG protein
MYTAVTHDIQVTVFPEFLPDRSEPGQNRFFWAYTIEIANQSRLRVQLISRYWQITDANGRVEEVRGLGVVGEQPILKPGESFRYTSGCPLQTASGIMTGIYSLVDETERSFDVEIPAFSLDSPHARRVLN